MLNTRNEFIDFLRFLGLCLIIFAHVEPPYFLFQLRNFDVPLMVIVSALSFSLAYKPDQSYVAYILSRMKRLALPVWVFLSGYFLSLYLLNPLSEHLNTRTIFESYAFWDGIGYVWIIRVFLLVALTAPFIYRFHINTISHTRYLMILTAVYLAYEISLYLTPPYLDYGTWKYIFEIIFCLVPYSLLFALGLRISQISLKQNITILGVSLSIFILMAVFFYVSTGHIVPTQHYKYPPSAYYISFSLVGCVSVFFIVIIQKYAYKPER